jgi:hypothetical protein
MQAAGSALQSSKQLQRAQRQTGEFDARAQEPVPAMESSHDDVDMQDEVRARSQAAWAPIGPC